MLSAYCGFVVCSACNTAGKCRLPCHQLRQCPMHCRAVMGFSSVMWHRYSASTACTLLPVSHWAFAAISSSRGCAGTSFARHHGGKTGQNKQTPRQSFHFASAVLSAGIGMIGCCCYQRLHHWNSIIPLSMYFCSLAHRRCKHTRHPAQGRLFGSRVTSAAPFAV